MHSRVPFLLSREREVSSRYFVPWKDAANDLGRDAMMGTFHAPPAPKGHLLGCNVREYARDPLGFLSRCVREYGNVVELRFMSQRIYLLSHPVLIQYNIVENNRNFTKTKIL